MKYNHVYLYKNINAGYGYGRWKYFPLLPTKAKLPWSFQRLSFSAQSCQNCQGLRILYFGSDAFSIGPLAALVSRMRERNSGKVAVEDVEVVTSESPLLRKTNKKQKPSDFVKFVKREKLKIHFWNKDVSNKISDFDFGLVASFGHLIPKKTIQMFRRGIINAHPSLLPKWRGAAPIIHTILNGDPRTGVSIINLSVGRFDKGKIFEQREIAVDSSWTSEILTEKLSNLAANMVLDVIDDYDDYVTRSYPQMEDGASYAPKISTDLSYIEWEKQTCDDINRLYRAIGGRIGLHTFFNDKLVKLIDLSFLEQENCRALDEDLGIDFEVGRSWFNKKEKKLFIKCLDGWIEAQSLQVEYKSRIRAADFYNAYMVDRKQGGISKDIFHSRLKEKRQRESVD